MVYLKSVENVITLGKLIGLLFLFCLPLLSILFLKTKRNDPCNENHFSSYDYGIVLLTLQCGDSPQFSHILMWCCSSSLVTILLHVLS